MSWKQKLKDMGIPLGEAATALGMNRTAFSIVLNHGQFTVEQEAGLEVLVRQVQRERAVLARTIREEVKG